VNSWDVPSMWARPMNATIALSSSDSLALSRRALPIVCPAGSDLGRVLRAPVGQFRTFALPIWLCRSSHSRGRVSYCSYMNSFVFPRRLFAAALVSVSVVACSRLPHDVPTRTPAAPPDTSTNTDVSKLYDSASLVEVRKFDDLPEAVKALANNSYMTAMLDNTPTKFLVGGVSDSRAMVAYEQFGYVPHFRVQTYVYSQSRWISGRQWDIGSGITNLQDLISITSSSP
jgi:hypothetical protein